PQLPQLPQTYTPRMVYVELFAACDMSCPMCVTLPYRDGVRRVMSREHIREKILEPCAARGMTRVIFGGGEPTLRKDHLEIFADAIACGYDVWLATNLARLTEEKLSALLHQLDGGRHTIAVSYDSLIPDEMNAIRGGAVHERVDRNCRRVVQLRRELGARVTFTATMIVQRENFRSINATIDYMLGTVGFDAIHVHPRHDYKSVTLENFRDQSPSEFCREHERDLMAAGLHLYHRASQDARIVVQGSLDDWINFVRAPQRIARKCDAGRMLFFNSEGVLRSCMFGTAYADVRTSDVADILSSHAYQDARQLLDTCHICHLSCN
ncbi:MAG: radical SAM protein, partial [bacterium]